MKLDNETKSAIAYAVYAAVNEALSKQGERYVSGKELGQRFQMFTQNWLKLYGHLLPRTRAEVTEASGEVHVTGWCYPVNRIGRMIEEGEIKRLANCGKLGSRAKLARTVAASHECSATESPRTVAV